MIVPADGRVAPRSGLAAKNFIDTGAGVIDADYRGEVKVLLFNHAETDFEVKEGDRVAQLVLERVGVTTGLGALHVGNAGTDAGRSTRPKYKLSRRSRRACEGLAASAVRADRDCGRMASAEFRVPKGWRGQCSAI